MLEAAGRNRKFECFLSIVVAFKRIDQRGCEAVAATDAVDNIGDLVEKSENRLNPVNMQTNHCGQRCAIHAA